MVQFDLKASRPMRLRSGKVPFTQPKVIPDLAEQVKDR